MPENRILLIIIIGLIILGSIIFILVLGQTLQKQNLVSISTDKNEYKIGESLKIRIKNNSQKEICFSSCYPYFMEEKIGAFKSYNYPECEKSDINKICLPKFEAKFFEIDLANAKAGIHRLAVPLCVGCKANEPFEETYRSYSNEFKIKQK